MALKIVRHAVTLNRAELVAAITAAETILSAYGDLSGPAPAEARQAAARGKTFYDAYNEQEISELDVTFYFGQWATGHNVPQFLELTQRDGDVCVGLYTMPDADDIDEEAAFDDFLSSGGGRLGVAALEPGVQWPMLVEITSTDALGHLRGLATMALDTTGAPRTRDARPQEIAHPLGDPEFHLTIAAMQNLLGQVPDHIPQH